MASSDTKPLIKSLTVLALFLLLTFNIMGTGMFDHVFAYMDEIVNSILTVTAVYGRWRASKKIDRVV